MGPAKSHTRNGWILLGLTAVYSILVAWLVFFGDRGAPFTIFVCALIPIGLVAGIVELVRGRTR